MDSMTIEPPSLEPRFQKPAGWRWHSFKNPHGEILRFGTVAPDHGIPDAIVIMLPGLSEFGEKYYELAHDMLKRNLSLWVLDWRGQGKSGRYLDNPHKRHSAGFNRDIEDLHYFLMEYVKHAAVHPNVGRIPLVMLGHSMGGNIGLRYLHRHPEMFACAAFSAPMIGIRAFGALPRWFSLAVSRMVSILAGRRYVPGGEDWRPRMSPDSRSQDVLSGDPVRNAIHDSWSACDPALQVGNVTFGWVYEALISCAKLQNKKLLRHIRTPCLLSLAGQDRLVDPKKIRMVARAIPGARLIELPDSHHEILMERDEIRDRFLAAFDEMLTAHEIREKVTPF
ncbi:MAG: alpha/beta hydrolase [Alphaproteobacteria bacterium]|nr:alpha/beta hydrolase [Alphaproteobacteria bacterium]